MILELTDRNGEERRLQGLLAHAWRRCPDFRAALAAHLNLADPPELITEEVVRPDDFRADLVVGAKGAERVIELKVWADLSDGQVRAARKGGIHLIICPRRQVAHTRAQVGARCPPILTWQELEALAAPTSAHVLFVGLDEWLEDGTVLKAIDLPGMLRQREKGPASDALKSFLSAIEEVIGDTPYFQVTSRSSHSRGACRYVGFHVTYTRGRGAWGLWVGFLWTMGQKEIVWIVQDCEEKYASSDLPPYADEDGQPPGKVLWRHADGGALDVTAIAEASIVGMYTVMGKEKGSPFTS